MLRLIISVAIVSLTIAGLGYAFIFWRAQDPSVVSAAALGQSPDPALVEMLRAEAASAVMGWWSLVALAMAVAALVWLLLALRRRPQSPAEARSGGLSWWVLLIVAVLAALAAGGAVYMNEAVAAGWRMALLLGGALVVPVAYWLTTAFGVQNEMAPSVPFATALRS